MPHSHQLNMFSIILSNNVRHVAYDKNINCIIGLGSAKFVGDGCQHIGMILPNPCTAFSLPSGSIHFGDVCEAVLFRFFASLFKAFRQWRTARSKESKKKQRGTTMLRHGSIFGLILREDKAVFLLRPCTLIIKVVKKLSRNFLSRR